MRPGISTSAIWISLLSGRMGSSGGDRLRRVSILSHSHLEHVLNTFSGEEHGVAVRGISRVLTGRSRRGRCPQPCSHLKTKREVVKRSLETIKWRNGGHSHRQSNAPDSYSHINTIAKSRTSETFVFSGSPSQKYRERSLRTNIRLIVVTVLLVPSVMCGRATDTTEWDIKKKNGPVEMERNSTEQGYSNMSKEPTSRHICLFFVCFEREVRMLK